MKDNFTKEDLQKVFGDDVSKAADFLRSEYPPYPNKPKKPFLGKDHTSKDATEYSKLLSEYEADMVTYRTEKHAYSTEVNKLDNVFEDYMKEISGFYNLPEKMQEKIWRKAWEDGHSSGYTEVYYHLRELVNLFDEN